MKFSELRYLIRSDLYRHEGAAGFGKRFHHWLRTPGFCYLLHLRWCVYLQQHPLLRFGPSQLAGLWLDRLTIRYGISIPIATRIGPGFYIGHFGGIFINPEVTFGRNCNISQGVTIGVSGRGEKRGCPVIGDNVYIGPGAKIIGPVRVGNHAAIGANCVVTRDVPDHGVVVGAASRIISAGGSADFVEFTDY